MSEVKGCSTVDNISPSSLQEVLHKVMVPVLKQTCLSHGFSMYLI